MFIGARCIPDTHKKCSIFCRSDVMRYKPPCFGMLLLLLLLLRVLLLCCSAAPLLVLFSTVLCA